MIRDDQRLPRSIIAFIQQEIKQSLQPFTNNLGQIDFTKGNGFSGTLAYPNGGTNNQLGQAVPKDGSVTDAKVAAGANIDPAKLNQALTTELVQDIVGALVLAGSGASIIDPTTTDGDLLYRHPRTVSSLVIGFIGDSITHDVPSGGTQTPAAIAVADLTGNGVTVTASNQALDATTSGDWTPTSPTGDYTAAKAAFASAGVRVVHVMLGANDAKTAVATTAATYRANLAAICADLVTSGYLVVLANPLSVVPPGPSGLWDSGSNTLLAAYGQQIATLVNGVTVLQGDTAGYGYFQANPSELADGVHPTATGATDLGRLWANALAPLVRGLTGTLALDRLGLGSEGQALLSTSGAPAWGTPHVYSPLLDPSGNLILTPAGDCIMAP